MQQMHTQSFIIVISDPHDSTDLMNLVIFNDFLTDEARHQDGRPSADSRASEERKV